MKMTYDIEYRPSKKKNEEVDDKTVRQREEEEKTNKSFLVLHLLVLSLVDFLDQ